MKSNGAYHISQETQFPKSYGFDSSDPVRIKNVWDWLRVLALGLVLSMLDLQRDETAKDRLLQDAVEWSFQAPTPQFRRDTFHFPGTDLALKELAYGYNFSQVGFRGMAQKASSKPVNKLDVMPSKSILGSDFAQPTERIARLEEMDWNDEDAEY